MRIPAPALPLALVLAALGVPPAAAFPDGAPWEAARGQGCTACHFDAPAVTDSSALALEGLPVRARAGATYRLTLRLAVAGMERAGFLISAGRGEAEAGTFVPLDARSEANGAKARSTEAGTILTGEGEAAWALDWRAPTRLEAPIRFEVWANAANGDESPLGDQTHRSLITVSP